MAGGAQPNREAANLESSSHGKTMAQINIRLDAMGINDIESKPSHDMNMSTQITPGSGGQPSGRRGGKKKQWQKLDFVTGQLFPQVNEQLSISGRKTYNGPPATAFHLFPKLAIEIRLKIWGHATLHPRFIEIEWGPKVRDGYEFDGVVCAGTDYRCRVSPTSRQPPTVLHVSQEARYEAKKSYRLQTFDTITPNHNERYIYYNSNSDIIYFGEETCISSLLCTFAAQPREPIPRIAITLSGKGNQKCCCDYDNTYGVNGGIRTMQALHGLFPPYVPQVDASRWLGALGLKEVFWVVPSNLWSVEQGKISANVGMRYATTNGLTKGQRSWKKYQLWDMESVKIGKWKPGNTKRWEVEKDRPKFSFISFAPPPEYDGVTTTLRDGLGCSTPAINLLRRNDCAFLKYVERTTGVRLEIPSQNYRDEDPREIGFTGTKEGVAGAKKTILDKLMTFKSDKIYVHRVSDAWEPEWNDIRQLVPGEL